MQLTHEQQSIYDLIESTDSNILIHGKPGVGKTVITRALKETGQKHYTIGAPTGLAALNAGGKTLHSLFGIQPSDGAFAPDFNIFTKNDHVLRHVYHQVKHLIIDEISMVRADMLDYIDRVLRNIKGVDEPFGGIQVICVGDFFQLPPVTKTQDLKQLKEYGYRSEFAFDANAFEGFKTINMEKVLRQADPKFINFLHAARTGDTSPAQLKLINNQVAPCTDFRIQLTGTNQQAELINLKQLSMLKTQPVKFEAQKFGYWPQNPVEQSLTLKVGAQVIIKKNNSDRPSMYTKDIKASGKIVNGSIAKIMELPTKEREYFICELEDGTTHNIYTQRWELKEKKRVDGAWTEQVVASYEQAPFQLAWAISMHKSQGQSFDKVHIDSRKIFAAGQLYVAVSRARTLEGISLAVPITKANFWADENVMRFNKSIYVKV
jgi:ATP-dependent DNA helicase PIF1